MSADGTRRYAHVRYPWRAALDATAPGPGAFYASLLGNGLRSGRRTLGGLGGLWRIAARHPPPESLLTGVLRRLPLSPRPDVDRLLGEVRSSWDVLARRSEHLPPEPVQLSALALLRSAGLTVFVFGESERPLLVLKVPSDRGRGPSVEASALREAGPAGVAPRALGMVGAAYVQEAIPGRPLPLEAVEPGSAAELRWSEHHRELTRGLARLAETTAKRGFAEELRQPVEAALAQATLSARCRRVLTAAWRDVARLDVAVLRHHDTSAENCLFADGRLSGIIDWEHAETCGAPGVDVLNTAISYMELGVGLSRWSERRAVEALRASWGASEFWREARAAVRSTAVAGGAPESASEALEVVFFGLRIGERLAAPRVVHPTGLVTAAEQLEIVCAP